MHKSKKTLIFFFFQAEDGIRDIGVTGVQTCALPISRREPSVLLRPHEAPHGPPRGRNRGSGVGRRPCDRGEPRPGFEPDPREPPGDRRGRPPSDRPSPDRVRQAGDRGPREGDWHLRGLEGPGDLRPARAAETRDPRAAGPNPRRGGEDRFGTPHHFLPRGRRGGKLEGGRVRCSGPPESEVCPMTYYLLKPCRTATAFISTLKKAQRVDLTEAAERLRTQGWHVSDVKVMLILEGEPELTLYESGKILVKTDDERLAREAVDRVYQAIGPMAPIPAAA